MVVLFGESWKAEGQESSAFGDVDGEIIGSILDGGVMSEDARIVEEASNRNVGSFNPDMFMEGVKNFRNVKNLYGERLLRLLTGFDSDYLEQNVGIPEFRKELLERVRERVKRLRSEGIVDASGAITGKGEDLAVISAFVEELDRLEPRGLQGEVLQRRVEHYGSRDFSRNFRKGDRYRDVNVRDTVRTVLRRGRKDILSDDLRVSPRISKGSIMIIYGLDSSASMKGDKLLMGKRAGIALAYKAIKRRDKVGVVVFSDKVHISESPSLDMGVVLKSFSGAHAFRETNFVSLFDKCSELFPRVSGVTKHLVIISDAVPTSGEDPEKFTLSSAAVLANHGVTISVIGINLDDRGVDFSRRIADIGNGRFYLANSAGDIDSMVLQDYYEVARN